MNKTVLITGGAGFIGSYVSDELLERGYKVLILDRLLSQVHPDGSVPSYLNPNAVFLQGGLEDKNLLKGLLHQVDGVIHLAAAVGVGQSMYEIEHYTWMNNLETSRLMEALIEAPVRRLVVASSMSIYGEGLYATEQHSRVERVRRRTEDIERGIWEPLGEGNRPLSPVPTPETKVPDLNSVYALSKFDQEQMALMIGRSYGISTAALRFFNVYGPRQSLANPYTGVMAIFASQLLSGNAPLIYEDGQQKRDFVHVRDIAHACCLALDRSDIEGEVFNIGSGRYRTVLEVAEQMAKSLNSPIEPNVTGSYRAGDIRHCYSDISKARKMLGYEPKVSFEAGLTDLVGWLKEQGIDRNTEENHRRAQTELKARGLCGSARRQVA